MAYTNYILFNNVFLKNLEPTEEESTVAHYLVHETARDWYHPENFASTELIAEKWLRPLLNAQSLDLAHAELSDPDAWYIVAPWDPETHLALCLVAPKGTDLDGHNEEGRIQKGDHWMIQAVNLARGPEDTTIRWVVLTNGEQWRLLDAHSLRRYEAYLEIDLVDLLQGEQDPLAAYLFYRLFRLEESFERDEQSGKNKLDAFLEESTKATESTEAYLKTSISDNLSIPGDNDGIMAHLCMGIVNAVDPSGQRVFSEAERVAIYRDATYLLYRLLFILYAEARGLLPVSNPAYEKVSLNRLIDEAKEMHISGEQALPGASQTYLWEQTDILFSAIYHSDEGLGIPAYNGSLFDNQDKPYLRDTKIENSYLSNALYELAFLLDPDDESYQERIDYCDLSVRHLGNLYEGMIDYRLFIAEEALYARRDKNNKVKYLPADKTEQKPTDEVIEPGKVYFAQSPHERKATGTHYTAEELVEKLVRQTVLRLLDERWEAFQPKLHEWLAEIEATPPGSRREGLQAYVDDQLENFVNEQVLSLRICDPAMGSGHFLVHIAHQLANYIVSVLSSTPWMNPSVNLNSAYWRRRAVENCLYGVDVNRMAVELAKLSLWLATMEYGRPLSFLDHHLKLGNSLLGVHLDEIASILTDSALNQQTRKTQIAEAEGQYGFREMPQLERNLHKAQALLTDIAEKVVRAAEDIHQQAYNYEQVEAILQPYKQVGDLLVAQKMGWKIKENDLQSLAKALEIGSQEMLKDQQKELLAQGQLSLENQCTFHWPLEFSQIFLYNNSIEYKEQVGFDIVIGNPPFLGGSKISSELGNAFLHFVKISFPESGAQTDLCAYFFRLGFNIINHGRYIGLVATNTISQGDTRKAGLAYILQHGGVITYVDRFVKWPGVATVEINLVSIFKRIDNDISELSNILLDSREIPFISSWLDDLPETEPLSLNQNFRKAFLGDSIKGKGFILSKSEFSELATKNPKNSSCIFPFPNGIDINSDPRQEPSRMVICFSDWTLNQAEQYPDLIKIVRERVKPQRDKNRDDVPIQAKRKRYWWLFGSQSTELYKNAQKFERVLARSRVSELHTITFLPNNMRFGDSLVVFLFNDHYHFALLQSYIHEVWLRRQASSLRTDIRYTPTNCFQTFPFPQSVTPKNQQAAELIGQDYYEHRQNVMLETQLGLTKTYNRFHDQVCQDSDIQTLRRLHVEMDAAILACYNWEDIELEYNFYPNDRKKIRYIPSQDAQREIFIRLIDLNQKIAAEEAEETNGNNE